MGKNNWFDPPPREKLAIGESAPSGGGIPDFTGSGSPEGVQAAVVGKVYRDTASGELYRKISDSGNTGWEAFLAPGGPTTDVLPVWTVGPIDADAGTYQLGSDTLTFGTINEGDDQAAVQATFDTALAVLAGASGNPSCTVTGDWSSFTVEFSHYILGRGMYVNANTLTKASVPVADPAIVLTERGHGQYVDMAGLYGQILGRAAPGSYSPFGDSQGVLMPRTSEAPYDGPFLNYSSTWHSLAIEFGTPFDLSDVQLKSDFHLDTGDGPKRATEVNTQAYEDAEVKAVQTVMHAEAHRDGSARLGFFDLQAPAQDITGHFRAALADTGLTVLIQQNAGQTGTVLDVQDSAGVSLFSVNAAGGVGFNGSPAVGKAASPVLLSDVITILRNLGLCS